MFDPEKIKEQAKEYRKTHKEYYKEYHKKYYQRHKNKFCTYLREYHKSFSGCVVMLMSRIKQRCNNSKCKDYNRYGGRGIKLCFTRIELLDWLKENNIDPRGLDIHRIDNDGNYELNNIMFLTRSEHTILHKKRD